MMFCKNCGNQINEGSRFCRNCGASLPPPVVQTVQPEHEWAGRPTPAPIIPTEIKCTQCQTVNRIDAKFCKSCGNNLHDRASATEQQLSVKPQETKTINEMYSQQQPAARQAPAPAYANTAPQKSVAVVPPAAIIPQPVQKVHKEPKPFPLTLLIAAIALLLIVCSGVGYFVFYKPYVYERDAPRFYTFAPSVFLRASPEAGVDYNTLGSIPYGSEVVVYENGYEWSKVKWKNNQTGKEVKGYISSAYILYADDFKTLNAIWGNSDAKERISTSKCRMALLNYFKANDLEGWKVYGKHRDAGYSTVAFPNRIVKAGSTFTDFAVIIKNDNSIERRLLLFYFDDDETPHLAYEEPAPPIGDIKSVTRSNNGFTVTYTQ